MKKCTSVFLRGVALGFIIGIALGILGIYVTGPHTYAQCMEPLRTFSMSEAQMRELKLVCKPLR